MREFLMKKNKDERGFSLIEILVVMFITAAIAAIAIPAYISQQKSVTDGAIRTVVGSVAFAYKDMLLKSPTPAKFGYLDNGDRTGGTAWLDLNSDSLLSDGEPFRIVSSNGDHKVVVVTTSPGKFDIYGWNEKGNHYAASTSAVEWSSSSGGFLTGTHSSPAAVSY